MDWVAHVTEALFSTYRGASKLPDEILAVEGYSSFLVRRLLNNLCDFDGCRYVEVGTWQGATALSASYLNMPGQALHHPGQDSRCTIPAFALSRRNTGKGTSLNMEEAW